MDIWALRGSSVMMVGEGLVLLNIQQIHIFQVEAEALVATYNSKYLVLEQTRFP